MPISSAFIARLLSVSLGCGALWGCNRQIGSTPTESGSGGTGSPVGAGEIPVRQRRLSHGGKWIRNGRRVFGGLGRRHWLRRHRRQRHHDRERRSRNDNAGSERRRAAAVAPADVARVPQHGTRPARGHDLGRGGRRPRRGGRHQQQRVPVSPADVDQHGRFDQPRARGRGPDQERRHPPVDDPPVHARERVRRGRLRQPIHHDVRSQGVQAAAVDHGGQRPHGPLPGGAHDPDAGLQRRHRRARRSDAAGARLPLPLGDRPRARLRDGAVVQLGNYQVASRLSYYLWGSMPDAMLFAAAAAGQLSTAEGVQTQAQRMLADAKAQNMVGDFVEDWLDVNTIVLRPKDPAVYSMWSPGSGDRRWGRKSAASRRRTSWAPARSAICSQARNRPSTRRWRAIYGVTGVTGTAPRAVTFDATQRAGILTLAGFLAVNGATDGSSPVVAVTLC